MAGRSGKGKRRGQGGRAANTGSAYVRGSVALKSAPSGRREAAPLRQASRRAGQDRDRSLYMNLGYVLFLAVALAGASFVLIGYLKLQSQLTTTIKNISSLESQLNSLKLSNEEEYNRAASSIDLEEIRRVAIGELGMRYATEGQVVNVTGEGSDYMRQLAPIE